MLLSLGRHQTTTCTNLFSVSIIYRRFIELIAWKHHKRWKTCNEHAQALRFLHCRTWMITTNQKLFESFGINHTVQRNNKFNILCSLNCLPCNWTHSNSLPLSYLYVSMFVFFSSLIDASYPCILQQYFVTNRCDQTDLLCALHHFTLSMDSSIQTVNVCVKRLKVRYSKQCASTTNAFEVFIWTFC